MSAFTATLPPQNTPTSQKKRRAPYTLDEGVARGWSNTIGDCGLWNAVLLVATGITALLGTQGSTTMSLLGPEAYTPNSVVLFTAFSGWGLYQQHRAEKEAKNNKSKTTSFTLAEQNTKIFAPLSAEGKARKEQLLDFARQARQIRAKQFSSIRASWKKAATNSFMITAGLGVAAAAVLGVACGFSPKVIELPFRSLFSWGPPLLLSMGSISSFLKKRAARKKLKGIAKEIKRTRPKYKISRGFAPTA